MVRSENVQPLVHRDSTPEAAVRDHLANERTLLAWQRTALGIIAIGILVDRFAFDDAMPDIVGPIVGILLIALGAAASIMGVWRFRRTEREIDTQTYRPALLGHLVLTGGILIGSMALVVFLVVSLER